MGHHNQDQGFTKHVQGILGLLNKSRREKKVDLPMWSKPPAVTLWEEDLRALSHQYGVMAEIQGVLGGLALDPFIEDDWRETMLYSLEERNTDLADLVSLVCLHDEDYTFRSKMLCHLSHVNPVFAIEAATRTVQDDPEDFVRVDAMELLAVLDTARCLELAEVYAAGDHGFGDLKEYCVYLLGRQLELFDERGVGHAPSAKIKQEATLIVAALYEQDAESSLRAAQAASDDGTEASRVFLSFALFRHPGAELRLHGLRMLNEQSPVIARIASALLLNDQDSTVRQLARQIHSVS